MTAPQPTPRDWIYLGLLGLIWGGSFLGVELALRDLDPITLATARITLAAVLLTAIAIGRGSGLPKWNAPHGPRIWAHCLVMALFTNAIPFALLSWAQQSVSSGFAGITMAAVPLLVLPLAHLMVPGERLTGIKATGFMIGFIGVVILIGVHELNFSGDGLARFACVAASACYAIGSINTRLCPPVDLLGYSAAGLVLAAVVMLPTMLMVEGVPALPGLISGGAVLYLGILPTALATVMLVSVTRSAGPSFLSQVNYQVPVWAVVLGVVVLNEDLPGRFIVALGLIALGLIVSRSRLQRLRP
ncbi:DMT family transporter [Pontivivens insulae]|uniref:Putative inner membrane transporter YedA n=1 Tax=Pontivivens insulae TaxID=1639689 RepID=A0A2R8A9N3_9RHOB|nr:EamA family transporter [Pontivivens insulae]RED12870.1 drug/metabolite transporter (DMT)-like permease [Pontivivens insulae]SPF28961.1 putative inner membrane transporter YedA [Pontivivens insulae]